jgi:hypothetical protein
MQTEKPSPNGPTTPALSARGARRAALGSGSLGSAVRVSMVWIEHSNPHKKNKPYQKIRFFPYSIYFPQLRTSGSNGVISSINISCIGCGKGGIGCRQKADLITPPATIATLAERQPHCRFS